MRRRKKVRKEHRQCQIGRALGCENPQSEDELFIYKVTKLET